jgi:hypothetical protein
MAKSTVKRVKYNLKKKNLNKEFNISFWHSKTIKDKELVWIGSLAFAKTRIIITVMRIAIIHAKKLKDLTLLVQWKMFG